MGNVYYCSIQTEDEIIDDKTVETTFTVTYYKDYQTVAVEEIVTSNAFKETLLDLCIQYVKESEVAKGAYIFVNSKDAMYHLQDMYDLGEEIAIMNKEDPMDRIDVLVTFVKYIEGSEGVIN